MIDMDFEYAIKKDVRNNPIVREVDEARHRQLWRTAGYLQRQLRHVDAFVALSRFSRDKHREFGFPREMEVLPHFLPAD